MLTKKKFTNLSQEKKTFTFLTEKKNSGNLFNYIFTVFFVFRRFHIYPEKENRNIFFSLFVDDCLIKCENFIFF